MEWRAWGLLVATLAITACSSGGSGGNAHGSPQSVSSWTCCATGATTGSCTCYENTPHTAHLCAPSVNSCGEMDGGVGCCVASWTQDDDWTCECWPPGADCSSKAPTGGQSVAACPP